MNSTIKSMQLYQSRGDGSGAYVLKIEQSDYAIEAALSIENVTLDGVSKGFYPMIIDKDDARLLHAYLQSTFNL